MCAQLLLYHPLDFVQTLTYDRPKSLDVQEVKICRLGSITVELRPSVVFVIFKYCIYYKRLCSQILQYHLVDFDQPLTRKRPTCVVVQDETNVPELVWATSPTTVNGFLLKSDAWQIVMYSFARRKKVKFQSLLGGFSRFVVIIIENNVCATSSTPVNEIQTNSHTRKTAV